MVIHSGKKQAGASVQQTFSRRLPIGAEVLPGGGAHFRVWAPSHRKAEVVIENDVFDHDGEDTAIELAPEENGYFSGGVPSASAGTLYRCRLDGSPDLFPDPASRFQPYGPHGPSQVIDPGTFSWSDRDWRGMSIEGQVLYEVHIGTFTQEGTFTAALPLLPAIARIGVTVLEIMPLADFAGQFGWGYDGVNFFAPTRLYGRPDDLRQFVDTAHSLGLGVILDVVYNHQGPDGAYLARFSEDYFTDRYQTEWGRAFNFDGPNSGPVREFIITNAGYWIEEFHFDGLRIDATQSMFDRSRDHIVTAVTNRVRASARGRPTIVVAENEPQDARLALPPERGGRGLDALWNDDFHHSIRVSVTGFTEGYYADYRGTPQELISAAKWGYLYQGQYYEWQQKRRGRSSLWLKPENFVIFIQNHDQVANSARGQRIHQLVSPGRYRAMTALMLLMPGTPMLFQGQEFASSSPFLYFADHVPGLAKRVGQGRKSFLAQFRSMATPEMQAVLSDPGDPATFRRSKLDHSERERNSEALALHGDLLRLRREDPVFREQRCRSVDGAVLAAEAFVLRYFEENGRDRLLIVNFGVGFDCKPAPEPLLAPPQDEEWLLLWSSEDVRYGGSGTPTVDDGGRWHIPAQAAVVMKGKTISESVHHEDHEVHE